MIAIDDVLLSDQIVEQQFVCDLQKCKGGCCEDGDAGAPLEADELDQINRNYEQIRTFLTDEGAETIEEQGRYHYDAQFGWVTTTIQGKMCAYGVPNAQGVIQCGIELAYRAGRSPWKKPISCHLYPIKTKKSKSGELTYVNYEPRESMCNPGCVLGKKLRVPVFVFLKEALIRKFGPSFYEALEATARHLEITK